MKAHGTQRSHGHASRIRDMYTPHTPSSLFYELHPHLRNVEVGQQPMEKRVYEYLLRRPGRTMTQIVAKIGGDPAKVARRINAHSTMFQRKGKLWFVNDDNR